MYKTATIQSLVSLVHQYDKLSGSMQKAYWTWVEDVLQTLQINPRGSHVTVTAFTKEKLLARAPDSLKPLIDSTLHREG